MEKSEQKSDLTQIQEFIYNEIKKIINNGGDFSEIFSKEGDPMSNYYYRHCTIRNTHLFFFDKTGQRIETNWGDQLPQSMPIFQGNDCFEVSSAVYEGFQDIINHILSLENAEEYYVACPTYITKRKTFKKQFVDCQIAVTGKLICDLTPERTCCFEMSGELGIIPRENNSDLFEKISTKKNSKIQKQRGTIHNYAINISNCSPYDGSEIIPQNFRCRDSYTEKLQIVVYGKLSDFMDCIPFITQKTTSKDLQDIRAIRLIPVISVPAIYPQYF